MTAAVAAAVDDVAQRVIDEVRHLGQGVTRVALVAQSGL